MLAFERMARHAPEAWSPIWARNRGPGRRCESAPVAARVLGCDVRSPAGVFDPVSWVRIEFAWVPGIALVQVPAVFGAHNGSERQQPVELVRTIDTQRGQVAIVVGD